MPRRRSGGRDSPPPIPWGGKSSPRPSPYLTWSCPHPSPSRGRSSGRLPTRTRRSICPRRIRSPAKTSRDRRRSGRSPGRNLPHARSAPEARTERFSRPRGATGPRRFRTRRAPPCGSRRLRRRTRRRAGCRRSGPNADLAGGVPGRRAPRRAVVARAVPGQAVPGQAVPGRAVPGLAVPARKGPDLREAGQTDLGTGGRLRAVLIGPRRPPGKGLRCGMRLHLAEKRQAQPTPLLRPFAAPGQGRQPALLTPPCALLRARSPALRRRSRCSGSVRSGLQEEPAGRRP